MATVANKAGGVTDKSFSTHNRTNAGAPNGTLTPEYAGEIVLDTTNHVRWRAIGTSNASWIPEQAEVT